MTERLFIKSSAGLIPGDEDSRSWFDRLKYGVTVRIRAATMRNPQFHRKFFKMLHIAYDNHEWPQIETPHGPATCQFKQFREYVTIRAGFYELGATPQGEPRARASSISFASMDQDEFERVYSAVLDVILSEFLTNWKRGDMDDAVNQMMEFA